MENLSKEQITAIKDYLTAQIALDKHAAKVKIGYSSELSDALKLSVNILKKVFTQDEVDFMTSATYRNDLVKAFLE